jgi:hypothetical protein
MAGVSVPKVQQLMGHATIQMTMRYAHLAPECLGESVMEIDRVFGGSMRLLDTDWTPNPSEQVVIGQKAK